jgi:hypothetical protein
MSDSTKPFITIHNLETDTVIEREMTDDEYANYLDDLANVEKEKLAANKKAEEKKAILERLGLSADELATLLG